MPPVSQKSEWELPPRLAEALGGLILGIVIGVGSTMFGIGLLSSPPTTANPTEISTTVTAPALAVEVKCSVLAESFREYGSRTSAGVPPADFLESMVEACITGDIGTRFLDPAELAAWTTEAEAWAKGQALAEQFLTAEGIEPVEHSPYPAPSSGPPPVVR